MARSLAAALNAAMGVKAVRARVVLGARRAGKTIAALLAHPRVMAVDIEPTDGFFVTLKPGWRYHADAMVPVHCFGADTARQALADANAAVPCQCQQCKIELENINGIQT